MINKRNAGKIISFALIVLVSSSILNSTIADAFFSPDLTKIVSSFKNISKKQAIIGVVSATAFALCSYGAYKLTKYVNNHESKLKFDFDNLKFDAKDLKFENKNLVEKEPFLWGVATSAYQNEGREGFDGVGPRNNWERCEGKYLRVIDGVEISGDPSNSKDVVFKPVPEISGDSCNFWEKYKEDIDLAKSLGFNTFRFSIAWEKVEPRAGEFNEKALQHYQDVCEYMVQRGIKPVITLHHYADPCWFADISGFEKEENIRYFVEFSETVFTRLNKYNPLWFTFNTFEGYALPGYSQGTKPPFKKDMRLAIEVLKNLLESHVRVYRALEKIDSNAQVGIYKNIHQLDPWNLLNPLDVLVSYIGNYIVNDAIYNFFKTGVFKVWIPTKVDMNYINPLAMNALRFVGVNFYSAKLVRNGKIITRPECLPTQNKEHCVYPEGFYRAIKSVSKDFAKPLNISIYVTENGIAAICDEDRETFYKQYLYAMNKAMEEGIDLRGYITWTLMDNYEWTNGYGMKYGLCSVDRESQERKLKPGTKFLLDVVKNNQTKYLS